MLVGLVAVILIFGIPLSAILGSVYLRAKRLELESGGGGGAAVSQRMAKLEAENDDLRKRVEVLETIVTTDAAPSARVRVTSSTASALETAATEPASARSRAQR